MMYFPVVIIVIALLALFAVLLALIRRSGSRTIYYSFLVSGLLLTPILTWQAYFYNQKELYQEQSVSKRPNVIPEDGYSGSSTCKSCHPGNYNSWHATYHRTMTQKVGPETVLGDFNQRRLELGGLIYQLGTNGKDYWVEVRDKDDKLLVKRRIVMTTGSHHYQVYWSEGFNSRILDQLPFVFLIDEKKWVPRKSVFLMPSRDGYDSEYGRWNTTCLKCHSTNGKARPIRVGVNEFLDTRVSEFGITCESCHGPGKHHISKNLNPFRRYQLHLAASVDENIINPGKLPARKSAQICGQCHSINLFKSAKDELHWRQHGVRFRPGENLHDYRTIVRKKEVTSAIEKQLLGRDGGSFWPDGMVRVSGREYNGLIESPCYPSGKLSCISCHEPHKNAKDPRSNKEWANDLLAYDKQGNKACTQCHGRYTAKTELEKHTHHAAGSEGSNCYNCHMPHTSYGLMKAIRSHQVDSPNLSSSLKTGRPNACNLCHMDKTLEWTSSHLAGWYGQAPVSLSQEQKNISASLLWLLKGDAGQRALVAWSMGWAPAQKASGVRWMAPFLAYMLKDDYEAIRIIALRSIRKIPGLDVVPFDEKSLLGDSEPLKNRILAKWKSLQAGKLGRLPTVLIRASGDPDYKQIEELIHQKDKTPVRLNE